MNRRTFFALPAVTLVPPNRGVRSTTASLCRVINYGPGDWVDTGINVSHWNADLAWDPIAEHAVKICAHRCLTWNRPPVVVSGPARCSGVSLEFVHGVPIKWLDDTPVDIFAPVGAGPGPMAWRVLVNPTMFNAILERQRFRSRS